MYSKISECLFLTKGSGWNKQNNKYNVQKLFLKTKEVLYTVHHFLIHKKIYFLFWLGDLEIFYEILIFNNKTQKLVKEKFGIRLQWLYGNKIYHCINYLGISLRCCSL